MGNIEERSELTIIKLCKPMRMGDGLTFVGREECGGRGGDRCAAERCRLTIIRLCKSAKIRGEQYIFGERNAVFLRSNTVF